MSLCLIDCRNIFNFKHRPHGGLRPFHQKSTCIMQLTLGLYDVQIWSHGGRVPLRIERNETRVLHRVVVLYISCTPVMNPPVTGTNRYLKRCVLKQHVKIRTYLASSGSQKLSQRSTTLGWIINFADQGGSVPRRAQGGKKAHNQRG